MMDTLVPAPTNNNKHDATLDAHGGVTPPQSLNLQSHQEEHHANNHLSDAASEEGVSELGITTRIRQNKEVLKEVFMPVYVRFARSNSDSRSPCTSPGEGNNLPHYMLYRNQPVGKPASAKVGPRLQAVNSQTLIFWAYFRNLFAEITILCFCARIY